MSKRRSARRPARVGLALAGGGPLGGIYEVGALIALDESLVGIDVHELDVYVGVSAGAFVSANLANRFSMAQIARIFISNESDAHPIRPSVFMRPALREYWRGVRALPGAALGALTNFVRHPLDSGVFGALTHLRRVIPNGVFANEPLRRFLADLYSTRGHTDDFRKLEQKLFIVAVNLDSGQAVVFGAPGHQHIPISTAVQASTALPGLYPPVEIEGEHYVDGGLLRTLHASVALESDIDLLLCVNPIVPFNASAVAGAKRGSALSSEGLPVVLSQSLRSLIHSRMEVGMGRYDELYADKDVILFEPHREDSRMFFTNLFSYSNRRKVCEHAYQSTRADLWRRREELAPILARHGIELNLDVLRDNSRTFSTGLSVPDDAKRRGRYKNRATNRLSETLDDLSRGV